MGLSALLLGVLAVTEASRPSAPPVNPVVEAPMPNLQAARPPPPLRLPSLPVRTAAKRRTADAAVPPAVSPAAGPMPVVAPASIDMAAAVDGGVLLRLLEHGHGPSISLAWPDAPAAREALYRGLSRCHGMQVAVSRSDGALFTFRQPPGEPWRPNLDRFSGYARAPDGVLPSAELEELARIRRHHGLPPTARPVRLFPRRADGELLAGLRALVGDGYRRAGHIRGRYLMRDGRIVVGDLSVDGNAVAGRVVMYGQPGCAAGD